MGVDSKIKMREIVENKDRKFGSWLAYYPVRIIDEDGNESHALFTRFQIEAARHRANVNLEDWPETEDFGSWVKGIFK